ncbi:MAG: hypothetical protein IJZ74_02070 [Clostridia bacterium]|nr:hypothetical protein [Clostridia bacterium]
MAEERTIVKPAPAGKPSLWDQALRAVKGDNTNELIEQFTQEMTLVAEGLCEDQARLRKAVDGLIRQAENQHDKSKQDYAELERQLDEQGREMKNRMDEMSRRMDAIENAAKAKPQKLSLLGSDMISRVTLLASIICGTWLLVTILKLFV